MNISRSCGCPVIHDQLELPIPTARLENWEVDGHYPIIWGQIYGDTRGRFVDGQPIHTSEIRDLSTLDLKPGMTVQTLNSLYLLGERGTP